MSAISAPGHTACVIDEPMTWRGFAITTTILFVIYVFLSTFQGLTLVAILKLIFG